MVIEQSNTCRTQICMDSPNLFGGVPNICDPNSLGENLLGITFFYLKKKDIFCVIILLCHVALILL